MRATPSSGSMALQNSSGTTSAAAHVAAIGGFTGFVQLAASAVAILGGAAIVSAAW